MFTIQLTPGFLSYAHEVPGPHSQSSAQEVLGIGLTQQTVACSGSRMEQLHMVHSLVLANNFLCPYVIRVITQVLQSFRDLSCGLGIFPNSELAEEQNTKEK